MFKSARREAVEQRLKTVINLHHLGKAPEFIASTLDFSLEYVKAAVIVNYDQPTYLRRLLEKIQRKSEYQCSMTGSFLHKPVLAADGNLYEKKVYESLTDVSQISIRPMFMRDLQARIKQYCREALKTTLALCIDKGFDPDLTLRLTAECLSVLDSEEDAEYFLKATAKLKDINHMIYLFTTLRDLRPSLLQGLLVELSQDRAQYQQTVQILRCIRYTDIKNSGLLLCEFFIRAKQQSAIDSHAYYCYYQIIRHKYEFKEDERFRVFFEQNCNTTSIRNLATIYNSLGVLFQAKGDREQAAESYMKCFEIWKAVLPSSHSDLATFYNNVGFLFHEKGDLEQAAEFYTKCLEIMKAVLPSSHPNLAELYNNLGRLFQAKGDLEQAAEFLMKSIEIRKAVLPTNHPDLAESYYSLGVLLLAKGDLEQAAEFYTKCLVLYEVS
jgi:tetratricopeptide (TPR) repeat protein